MLYLSNAFSLNMINGDVIVRVVSCGIKEVSRILKENKYVSIIGHKDIAAIVSSDLGLDVEYNRQSVSLKTDDVMVIAQYIGPRLIEGTTELPDGTKIEYRYLSFRG